MWLLIGSLMASFALAIGVDPARAPALILIGLASAAFPWRDAWREAGGTALRPALIWVALALAFFAIAQLIAFTEPLSDGRPVTARITYIAVLAVLAALVSVLNARTPGERVWAGLMVLLVVVFLIPWLEEAGRMRRAPGMTLIHLDSPWTLFYGILVIVGVTNYLPTRYGLAAACLGLGLVLEYLGLTRTDWPAQTRAVVWEWVAWTFALSLWIARRSAARAPATPGFDGLWFWFRDHWGVVWALRTQERFNRMAQLARWPLRLSWFGLEHVDPHDDSSPTDAHEVESTFRGLIRLCETLAVRPSVSITTRHILRS